MKKEDITTLAQLMTGMKDAINKLEKAQKEKNIESLNMAKKDILDFQKEIDKLL